MRKNKLTSDRLLYYNYDMKEKIYYYNGELELSNEIVLEGEEFHHLSNVMRARNGDKLILFNGNGVFYHAEISELAKKYAKIKILSEEQSKNEPKVHLTIFQALAKGDKLSLVMQKITELGASELAIFDSEFCDVKANTTRVDRLETIAISASKQCKRATITKQSGVYKLSAVAKLIPDFDAFYVAYENKDGLTLADDLIKNKQSLKNVAVMIGAEGGFSEKEIDMLETAGAKIVSMGNRILRTETAAITGAAVVMQILETT